MALQTLRGAWIPMMAANPTISAGTYVIDATGEKAVLVLRCPKAGTLDRFDFNIGTVTNSPDNGLRASFQGVNATDGQNDGTILGATNNAFVTYAHTVTTGWKSTNFGETVTVTRGQLIACVVDIPSFTASDSVTLSRINFAGTPGLPYGISDTGTKQLNLPLMALHYTDGYGFVSPLLPGADTSTSIAYKVDSASADEWGLAFSVPYPCTLDQIAVEMTVAAGADCEVLVYDSDGSTVLSTLTHDGDVTHSVNTRLFQFVLGSAVSLSKNTVYRVSIRPTTTNTVTMQYNTLQSVALLDTMEGGQSFYMTSRLNQAGSWTDYNSGTFRRPRMFLYLTAFDDAVSAGTATSSVFLG